MFNNMTGHGEQRHNSGEPFQQTQSQNDTQSAESQRLCENPIDSGSLGQSQSRKEAYRLLSRGHPEVQHHTPMTSSHVVVTNPPSCSISDRFRGTRHHAVPPNNHSPRHPAFFVNSSTFNGGNPKEEYQYHQMSNGDQFHESTNDRHPGRVFGQSPGYMQTPHKDDSGDWPARTTNQQITTANNEAEILSGPHTAAGLLSSFGSVTSTSAATASAIANIASLINSSTSCSSLTNIHSKVPSLQLQSPSPSTSCIMNQQRPAFAGHAFAPTMVNVQHTHGFHGNHGEADTNNHTISTDVTSRSQHNPRPDQLLALQRELEQERSLRTQMEQRLVELTQKVHSQHLVEKSYEDVVQKYKLLVTQMQQMSVMIERYKAVLKQLEQEKRILYSENVSLKAQKSAASDKNMMYNILMERSRKLEEENSSLVLENETYQRRYERCIDEISKQVVQALLTQKTLQEQCMQLQDRLGDVERENSEYYEVAVRQARQASSDSRLGWSYRSAKARTHTASPSADSVRSMPAQHHYWRQSSVTSLEHQYLSTTVTETTNDRIAKDPASVGANAGPDITAAATSGAQAISIETEFPANNGSPKSTRRSMDRHPSSGSLDSAYHSRGFVKYNGRDVRCQRSVSAEALRDIKVNMRVKPDLTLPVLPKSSTAPTMSSTERPIVHQRTVQADVHTDLSPGSTIDPNMTDSGLANDPFADDADDILSKHQSLIVGSMEDLFIGTNSNVRDFVIQEEGSSSGQSTQEKRAGVAIAPTPPPRPRSRCLSECSFSNEARPSQLTGVACGSEAADSGPPPLPPKQYRGSRRKYKPLPAEPTEAQCEDDSSDKNTDSDSIKQEINALTSQIAEMASTS